jgi:hypothetical protein
VGEKLIHDGDRSAHRHGYTRRSPRVLPIDKERIEGGRDRGGDHDHSGSHEAMLQDGAEEEDLHVEERALRRR